MKKRLIAAVASVCLVAVVGVGATLAYYTSATEAKVNTFTIGNVDITLTEPNWDPENGKDLVPGAEVEKNPMITNTGASDGYMMLKVDGMAEMAELGFIAMTGDAEGYNTADWTLVDENGNVRTDNADNKLVDGYYVYKGAVTAGQSTSALFTAVKLSEDAAELANQAFQVVGDVVVDDNGDVVVDENGSPIVKYTINGVEGKTFDTYAEAEDYVMTNYKADATFVFDLTVQGYAIQSENVEFQTAGVYTWVADLTK